MAATLKEELGIDVSLVRGKRGSFEVKVDDVVVSRKGWFGLPADRKVVNAVKVALGQGSS